MLYSETPEIHMHTLKIGIIDVSGVDGYDFEVFRDIAYPRLYALAPLRYQLVDIPLKLHHPMWVQNRDIDLDYHLRRVTVPAPGGRRELDELIGRIASTPLDRRHPLWEMYVVDGLTGDRVAIVHKVHHVLADGVASANQMGMALQPEVAPVPQGSMDAQDQAWTRGSLLKGAGRDHVGLIRKIPRLVGETATGVSRVRRRAKERGHHPDLARNFSPPACFINHVVSPGRRFATAPLALADVKQTSKHLGVTLNDIVLATAAGALRRLLLRYDGRADSPLIAGVPISFNTSPERLVGNEFTYMTPSLPVHIDDPLERVKLTALATKIAKENHQLLGPTVLPAWMSYLPTALAPRMFRTQARRVESASVMNLTISNVPGPRDRGHIAGGVVSEIYSVGPIVAGSGMNITVWSYVDQLAISVLTDDRTLGDPHEATDALVDAFTEIRRAAGLSDSLTPLDGTLPMAAAP
jgi:diacylglycerol O-acyltransferase / wax synthase